MLTVGDVLKCVEEIAPPELAYSFDKIGLQVGDPNAAVTKIVTTLDSSEAAIAYASHVRAQLIVAHHPVIWDPVPHVGPATHSSRRVFELAKNNLSLIAAHTNWDCAEGGINDTLASELRLRNISKFGSSATQQSYKLVVFVPVDATERVMDAVCEAGAGVIGHYSRCTFRSIGTGSFLAGEGAKPVIGSVGTQETVAEERVETIVHASKLSRVLAALKSSHPYEEPAFDLVRLNDSATTQIGRIGELAEPLTPGAFGSYVDQCLGCRCQVWTASDSSRITKVAVVGGAAAGEWQAAKALGAQAYVTGEVPQHLALEASECGVTMVAAGHYHTEHPGMAKMAVELRSRLGCDITVFEPEPGTAGRPL